MYNSQSATQAATLRIAVLVSGTGSNLQALIDAIESKELSNVEIVLVVSNKADAPGLQRSLKHKIPSIYLPWRDKQEAEFRLRVLLDLFKADLIVLAGWMRIFTPEFINEFPQRIINLHPALLPDSGEGETFTTRDGTVIPVFRGLHVVERALESGIKVTGTTVHFVIPEVDAGPVIARAEVSIEEGDTAESLHERIKQLEHHLIVETVRQYQLQKMH